MKKYLSEIILLLAFIAPSIGIVSAKLEINVNSDKQQNTWYNQDVAGQFIVDSTTEYSWQQTSSSCNASCGGGTRSLYYSCMGTDGNVATDSSCSSGKPSSYGGNCNTHACPQNGSCGSSAHSCNSGSLGSTNDSSSTYRWTCNGNYGGSATTCSRAKPVPIITPPTGGGTPTLPSYTYSWSYGNYGSCQGSCPTGVKVRSATCKRNDGANVSSSLCSGSPATTAPCGITCPVQTGSWVTISSSVEDSGTSQATYCNTPCRIGQSCSYWKRLGSAGFHVKTYNVDWKSCQ